MSFLFDGEHRLWDPETISGLAPVEEEASGPVGGDISATLGTRLYRWLKDYSAGTWTCEKGSGNATYATSANHPTAATTDGGQSYPDFDGAPPPNADRLNLGALASLPVHAAGHHYVWGCLLRVDATPEGPAWIIATDGTNQYVNGGKVQIAGTLSNAAVVDGTWRRVIVVKNGASGVVTQYVDGVAQTQTSTEAFGADWRTTGTATIGTRYGDYRLDGGMASMFFGCDTTTAFSADDIAALDADLQAILEGGGEAPAEITGGLSATLLGATLAAAGSVAVAGQASSALAAAAGAATGAVRVAGDLSGSLDAATVASSGSAPARGTAAATLDATTAAAAGAVAVVGGVAASLAGATLAATGAAPVTGQSASGLADAAVAAAGGVAVSGALAGSLADASSAAAGAVAVRGGADASLAAVALAAAATTGSTVQGELGAVLEGASATGAGVVRVAGELEAALGDAAGAGAGRIAVAGELARSLEAATGDAGGRVAVGGELAGTLEAATLSALAAVTGDAAGTVLGRVWVGRVAAAVALAARPRSATRIVVGAARRATRISLRVGPSTRIHVRSPMEPLDIGDDAEIPLRITRSDGVSLIDPTALSVVVTSPAGVEATYLYPSANLSRSSVGLYTATIPCTEAGVWRGRVVSPGPIGKASEPFAFVVRP